jgi:hypothetical protein
MVAPTRKPSYVADLRRSIRFHATYIGVTLDPEGRNDSRFAP